MSQYIQPRIRQDLALVARATRDEKIDKLAATEYSVFQTKELSNPKILAC